MDQRNIIFIGLAAFTMALVPGSHPAAAATVIEVANTAELAAALSSVPDGGVIELAAGSYVPPSGGFAVSNAGRGFSIRAASSGSAILDGQGSTALFDLEASSLDNAGWVSFEGLVFENGYSADDVRAGGVTVNSAQASFTDCVFDSNVSVSAGTGGSGGGIGVIGGSFAIFNRCTWIDNTASTYAAGMLVGGASTAYVHDSVFLRNRTDVVDHRPTASGAGLNVRAATVWVTNTRFEANVTGFAGGGMKVSAAWTDPAAFAVVANCTFVDNRAEPDRSVTTPSPAAGAGMMVEAQADVYVYNSRFINNSAELGGGISTYRSLLHVYSSVFRGNEARSANGERGRGGAIKASSNDVESDGNVNYRSAELLIRDSFFQGRYENVGATAQSGGCIYAAGDTNRMYGDSGVSQMGTLADNRALVDIEDSAFVDCDVEEFIDGEAVVGGSAAGNLVDFSARGSIFIDCDAPGDLGRGGSGYFAVESLATFDDSTFVGNTAGAQGGALRVSGSELQIDGCLFSRNEVSPGVVEPENDSLGAVIYSIPDVAAGVDVTGLVQSSTFTGNIGMAIHDEDRNDSFGAIDAIRYNGNTFFESTFGNHVYRNKVEGGVGFSAAGLNSLIVDRGNGNTTDKSPLNNNVESATPPVEGTLTAAPPEVVDVVAAGDVASATESFLVYGYSGDAATLDGTPVGGGRGFELGDVGSHVLSVDGQDFSSTIGRDSLPEGSLTANPEYIASGESSTLSWQTLDGTFIQSVLNWDLDTAGADSGNLQVVPPDTRTFVLNLVTRQGGAMVPATVFVDEAPLENIFADDFEGGDTGEWSSVSS